MPYDFHSDPDKKWRQQYLTARDHIIPFIEQVHPLPACANVLEIGCGEGGVLKAFSERGHRCFGVDIAANRIENAKAILHEEVAAGRIAFYTADVHDTAHFQHLEGQIDLLILKDAIEHIPDQGRMLEALHRFVKTEGIVFFAFPPWLNPFGGHQQMAESFLKYTPWVHLLPRSVYRTVLKACGESERKIAGLLEVYDTGLTIGRFERLLRQTGWHIVRRQFYLLNPIYEYKFGIKGRRQFFPVTRIPVLRDFVSTGVYYIVRQSGTG